MPNRILRDSITESESLSRLTGDEERLFYRLVSKADDYGRFDARVSIVRANCFKLQLAQITDPQVEQWLQALARPDVGIVRFYEVAGRRYGVFCNWGKYQQTRAKESKYPPPPADGSGCQQMLADALVIGIEYGIENDTPGVADATAGARQKRPRVKPSKEPPNPDVTLVMRGLEQARGYPSGNHPMEAKEAKAILQQGYSAEEILNCAAHFQGQPFWAGKTCELTYIRRQIGAWKQAAAAPVQHNGNHSNGNGSNGNGISGQHSDPYQEQEAAAARRLSLLRAESAAARPDVSSLSGQRLGAPGGSPRRP